MKKLIKRSVSTGVRMVADLRRDILLRRKIGRMLARIRTQGGAPVADARANGGDPWRRAYAAVTGIDSPNYVSEPLVYNVIEPYLNDAEAFGFYSNKNNLDRLDFNWTLPRTIGRLMGGRFLGPDYLPAEAETAIGQDPVVVKPSAYVNSGAGKAVRLLGAAEAVAFVAAEHARQSRAEYIFQAPIAQSQELARFGPGSVNTLRILTMLGAEGSQEVSSLLRMGTGGSFVDNLGAGGLACGVRGGRLAARAFDRTFRAHTSHPDTGAVFDGAAIPGWDAALALALRLQAGLPELGLISWDIAIDKADRPVVIEFNARYQEINAHQLANGPLFGEDGPRLAREARARHVFGFVTR